MTQGKSWLICGLRRTPGSVDLCWLSQQVDFAFRTKLTSCVPKGISGSGVIHCVRLSDL